MKNPATGRPWAYYCIIGDCAGELASEHFDSVADAGKWARGYKARYGRSVCPVLFGDGCDYDFDGLEEHERETFEFIVGGGVE